MEAKRIRRARRVCEEDLAGVAGYARTSRRARGRTRKDEPARDGWLCPALGLRVRAGEGRRRLPGVRGTWDKDIAQGHWLSDSGRGGWDCAGAQCLPG